MPLKNEKISIDLRMRAPGHFILDDYHPSGEETCCVFTHSATPVGMDEVEPPLSRETRKRLLVAENWVNFRLLADLMRNCFISTLYLSFFVEQIVSSATGASRGCAPSN